MRRKPTFQDARRACTDYFAREPCAGAVSTDISPGGQQKEVRLKLTTSVMALMGPTAQFLSIFYTFAGRFGARDLSQRLHLALISNFPRRMHFLDAYSSSYGDFRRFVPLVFTPPTRF